VKYDGNDHPLTSPFMDIPHKPAKGNNIVDVFHTIIGALDGRNIINHEDPARYYSNHQQKKGDETQTKSIIWPQTVFMYPGTMKMKEKIIDHQSCS
jgi:hypothetical protein